MIVIFLGKAMSMCGGGKGWMLDYDDYLWKDFGRKKS